MKLARELAERSYFFICLAIGRVLRSATYSKVRIERRDGDVRVLKRRRFYAPFLIWMGGPLARILDSGVRVLSQREWEEREREVYRRIYGTSIRIDAGGVLVLPRFSGVTLAVLLEDPELDEARRMRAIELAVVALTDLHARGVTHADAMAENVMVDLDAGVAHWFDFETTHDASRSRSWQCADDVRALLATCLLRTVPAIRAEIFQYILDTYPDQALIRVLATSFTPTVHRPLSFHLAQAALSLRWFREIGRLLHERLGDGPPLPGNPTHGISGRRFPADR